ncbi:MAG: hypothetical protein GY856_39535 [bacterium]|nr:hypothetical protein [bacterium]
MKSRGALFPREPVGLALPFRGRRGAELDGKLPDTGLDPVRLMVAANLGVDKTPLTQ